MALLPWFAATTLTLYGYVSIRRFPMDSSVAEIVYYIEHQPLA